MVCGILPPAYLRPDCLPAIILMMRHSHLSSPLECFCGRIYTDAMDLEEHRVARGHFPSHRCTISCRHPLVDPPKFQTHDCGSCGRIFEHSYILNDHHIATGHCFCSVCDLHFETQKAFKSHRDTELHASEFTCCDCNISFRDVQALVAHMTRSVHRRPVQQNIPKSTKKSETAKSATASLDMRIECSECQRTFRSAESLQQHRESLRHKPLSDLSCPVGNGCRGKFTAPSALLHHLESGSCKSGMDRDEIYRIVQSCDEDGIIHSHPALTPLISPIFSADRSSLCSPMWMTSSGTNSEWSLLTPSSVLSEGSVEDSLEQWSLIEGSQSPFGGSLSIDTIVTPTLQCPLCPRKRSSFASALSLQQHMNSPAHSAKLYHCPSNLFSVSSRKKGEHVQEKHFSTLSGLSQHLESGGCRGGKETFLHCINLIQGRLEQLGLGGMRVLLPSAQG